MISGRFGISYLVGTLLFNFACLKGVLRLDLGPAAAWWFYWAPCTLGSLCFCGAATIEFVHNSHVRCSTPVFWLCFWYLAGSLLFLFAASAGYPGQPYEDALVNVSVEKKDDVDGKLIGYIRIRSKTQGIALSLGDRITSVQRGAGVP